MDGNWLNGYREGRWELVADMGQGVSFEMHSTSGYQNRNHGTYYAIFRITSSDLDRIDYSVAQVHPDINDAVLILVMRSETIDGKTLSPDDFSDDGRIYAEKRFPGVINRIKNNAALWNFQYRPSYLMKIAEQLAP